MATQPTPLTERSTDEGAVVDEGLPTIRDRAREAIRGAADRVLGTTGPILEEPQESPAELESEVADILYRIGNEVRRAVRENTSRGGDWHVFALGVIVGWLSFGTAAGIAIYAFSLLQR